MTAPVEREPKEKLPKAPDGTFEFLEELTKS